MCKSNLADSADFLLVYTDEAHPTERKHYETDLGITAHADIEDRKAAAQTLVELSGEKYFPCPVAVDLMDESASRAYGTFPERLYIVEDGVVVYEGKQGPWFYDFDEMEDCLHNILEYRHGKKSQ